MDPGEHGPDRDQRRTGQSRWNRFQKWALVVGVVAAVATVIATVYAVLSYHVPNGVAAPPPPDGTSGPTPSATVPPPAPPPPPPGSAQPDPTYLRTLTPVTGGSRISDLPRPLQGLPEYEHAIVIACPSNQTGDQMSEVRYTVRRHYETFTATMHPYRDPADGVRFQLEVYADPPDREPGGPDARPPHRVQATVDGPKEVRADILDAYVLRLRVGCEAPGGYLILNDAAVIP